MNTTEELDLPILIPSKPPTDDGESCRNCYGSHHTWQCPGIGALLHATYDDFEVYKARDARISIGLPIKQDNGEYEYPGFIDEQLIGFYATRHHADVALHNILAAEMPGAFGVEVLDLDFAPVGWPV